jgi:serine/threonine protein kinase/dienelactone hydrolase
MIGQSILHYKILEKLGEGGMGVVYKAKDTKLDRFVALKFLPSQLAASEDDKARFIQEAKAAAALNHPNITTIHAIEESDEGTFIVMEFIDGIELKEKIKSGPITTKETVNIALQIAEGLDAAHKNGIIHRDIKSSNIMITGNGKVKIMDFGLAKLMGQKRLTKTNTAIGTVAYMSPEQAKGEKVDHRTDIWSFGVVLYEMLTGKLPFKGEYEQAMLYLILHENPEPITALRLDIPEKITKIVYQALEKEPENRFASMTTFLDKLKTFNRQPKTNANIKTILTKPKFIIPSVMLLIVTGLAVIWWLNYKAKVQWARQIALPEMEKLTEDINVFGEGLKPWKAFKLATDAEDYIPDDPLLNHYWNSFSRFVKIYSEPSGANVYIKSYADFNAEWWYVGETPIDSARLPIGFSRIKFEKEGFRTVNDVFNNLIFFPNNYNYMLPKVGSIPKDMVFIQGKTSSIDLPGLSNISAEKINDFLMDRFEVTNKEYKNFIDSGGYRNKKYWKFPFIKGDTILSWQSAIARFTDKTGRYGPATWELGNYPEGEDNYPVTGVSWYEAAAYAEFSGKSLPTIYHWNLAALIWASSEIIPLSNLNGKGPVPVGSRHAMNSFGTNDLAGNVREWCWNKSSRDGQRFILGGSWDDPGWTFIDPFARPPIDRSPTNGFRCIKYIEANDNQNELVKSIELVFRNYFNEKPVSDETFTHFIHLYQYDKTSLNAKIEYTKEEKDWIKQRITFDAAYGNERMIAYLFLPKHTSPPYQTVVYFPGSTALHSNSSERSFEFLVDFLPRDGRAIMYPIYKSTYERGDDLKSDYQDESNFYKEHVIMWAKDLSRSIDYLETRDDIDTNKIAYYGGSWGGVISPIMLAVEKRIKVAVLRGAGLTFESVLPEADPFNYLPRVNIPVLMLNGRYDFFLPVETSQKPFFKWLGTPTDQKVIHRYDSGHGVPRIERIKETLAWLDHYLGPVE